jgi:hypothetical protein
MSYKKIDQATFAANLAAGEIVVQVDTGELVAVRAIGSVEPNSGNVVIDARARAVAADGTTLADTDGQPIQSSYSASLDAANLTAHGGIDGFRRNMILTVLGEPCPDWPGELDRHQDVLDHASIRMNLVAASHAGPAMDLGAIL